ncbi:thioesterase family protein [uncultured Lutibacter sp.]|uniref:acyl-CoA thioesterase n=1 Tax=uncultured Lutibacter sp. TaxID=437739 RepID=UPI0026090EAD|nr:thioesterase family protein [uncultured Lutibacter sp.]
MSKVYLHNLIVEEKSIDYLNHVNNVAYLEWAQLIAEKHWTKISTKDFKDNFVWVVVRHEVDYYSSALLGDKLTIKTWIGELNGLKSVRYVTINRADKLLCSVKTYWCLLNKKTMKPTKIPKDILEILNKYKPN